MSPSRSNNAAVDLTYTADQIQVLEGLEAVRKRPGMYIGGTDIKALHHMVFEVVDNAVDEAMAGACDRIDIVMHADQSISVNDNGRGIPVGIHKQTGVSALETVMTKLHAGGKFGGGGYKVSGGLHGVGVSAVNALSTWLEAEVRQNGSVYLQRFERGIPQGAVARLRDMEPNESSGTKISFLRDDTIFESPEYHWDLLQQRLREMAFLTRRVTVHLSDKRQEPVRDLTFYFDGGVKSFVRYLNRGRGVLHEIVHVASELEGTQVDAAWQYTDTYTDNTYTFANTIITPDGGVHLTGFRAALTRVINDYGRKAGLLKDADTNLSGDDVREGITAVVSVKVPDPQFESQTKVKLLNAEVRNQVETAVAESFTQWLEEHPRDGRAIVEKCLTASRARAAARHARDLVIRKSALESGSLPGKLADCATRDPTKAEVYIVEGDSAGGTAKQGRDRHFQAILPLRGKILNVEKARLDKILQNNEIRNLVLALGIGIGNDLSLEHLRYHRVIVMTDADVDGSHIRTLLLTFFYRYMPALIDGGHLYIAQPPLFLVKSGRQERYTYSEAEKNRVIEEFGEGRTPTIQRYKGLGEMNAEQLWVTTMDPTRRQLLRVTVEDAAAADHTFEMLMGQEVMPRKRFIMTHAQDVKNLDV
ncbi:MAG: DNA topoisomerase (ATP-hydrolyzing) subunit B [Ardenticatenia bacterium]|nr:DNA topoisomerase (ATP-hydrolyzing) subunit B [Ardenticatenia bacterium]